MSRRGRSRLPASVWKQLDKLRGGAGGDDPVFPSRTRGGALKAVAVLRIVRQAARRAGIELCALCWRDVQANGEGGQISVFGKGDKTPQAVTFQSRPRK